MRKREIGQEVLDSIRAIKSGKIGRVTAFMSPEEIRKVRLNVGATQRAFAAMMNISLRTVQDWEQGRRKPDGPAQSLLVIAATRPDVMKEVFLNGYFDGA